MKIHKRARLVTTSTLALALAAGPVTGLAADGEPDIAAAARKHFAAKNGSASEGEGVTSSPAAMVAYFTSEAPPGDTTVAARRKHVDLDVKFGFDSDALDGAGISELDVAGKALQSPQLKTRRFVLAGHTDDQGNVAYNLDLSQRRAQAARSYLISEYGIEPERLDAVGYGSEQPRSTDASPEARRANRRVVLELVQ
jgi:OOP family OmpA-OmpF porin